MGTELLWYGYNTHGRGTRTHLFPIAATGHEPSGRIFVTDTPPIIEPSPPPSRTPSSPGHWQGTDLLLTVHVQPRASRVRVLGLHGTALKVALTAPPVEGAANQALRQWLAKAFHVAKSRVSIVTGEHSRHKRVRIQSVNATDVRAFFQRWELPEPTGGVPPTGLP